MNRYDDYQSDDDYPDVFDEGDEGDNMVFANVGSALRAASATNPRIHPCPSCGAEDKLTPADVALGYQCDMCAYTTERGGY